VDLIDKIVLLHHLSREEVAEFMTAIVQGRANPIHIAAFLIGLEMRGIRLEELLGLANVMRQHAILVDTQRPLVFDTCGTGGDGSGSFNISSCTAIVVAACGVPVAKHGNRSVSSHSGSADVFEALGVRVTTSPAIVQRCLDEAGIGFFFAPTFHPSMKHAAEVRRALARPTVFNLLGPLTNPANATHQLVGVRCPGLTELIARALMTLGSERAWVVHASDGLDEISTVAPTKISEAFRGSVRTFYVHPSKFGIPKADTESLKGGNAQDNAAIIRAILDAERGPTRDIVLLNAGASLFIAGKADSVKAGITLAGQAIDSGAARETLNQLVKASQHSC
jgi:anthranilate phosphoribosyltransferase